MATAIRVEAPVGDDDDMSEPDDDQAEDDEEVEHSEESADECASY